MRSHQLGVPFSVQLRPGLLGKVARLDSCDNSMHCRCAWTKQVVNVATSLFVSLSNFHRYIYIYHVYTCVFQSLH